MNIQQQVARQTKYILGSEAGMNMVRRAEQLSDDLASQSISVSERMIDFLSKYKIEFDYKDEKEVLPRLQELLKLQILIKKEINKQFDVLVAEGRLSNILSRDAPGHESPGSTSTRKKTTFNIVPQIYDLSIPRQPTSSTYFAYPLKTTGGRHSLGLAVVGLDLSYEDPPLDVIQQIKADLYKHGLLIFKKQNHLSPDRHIAIANWFGEVNTNIEKHYRSPHPGILRISNDAKEGIIGIARNGWSIDGCFLRSPIDVSLTALVSKSSKATSGYVSLPTLLERVSPEKRREWERLWIMSDRREDFINPLVYQHPVTKRPTMCFNLAILGTMIRDAGQDTQEYLSWSETVDIIKTIKTEICKFNADHILFHRWNSGDLIIRDNRAVAIEMQRDTQVHSATSGLFVVHRVSVKGTVPPTKGVSSTVRPSQRYKSSLLNI